MLVIRHISVCCLEHTPLSLFVVCVLRVKERMEIGQQNPSVRLNHNTISIDWYSLLSNCNCQQRLNIPDVCWRLSDKTLDSSLQMYNV